MSENQTFNVSNETAIERILNDETEIEKVVKVPKQNVLEFLKVKSFFWLHAACCYITVYIF